MITLMGFLWSIYLPEDEHSILAGYKTNCTDESRMSRDITLCYVGIVSRNYSEQEQNQEPKTNVWEVRTNWQVKRYWRKLKEWNSRKQKGGGKTTKWALTKWLRLDYTSTRGMVGYVFDVLPQRLECLSHFESWKTLSPCPHVWLVSQTMQWTGPVDSGSSMAPLSVYVPINLVWANKVKRLDWWITLISISCLFLKLISFSGKRLNVWF